MMPKQYPNSSESFCEWLPFVLDLHFKREKSTQYKVYGISVLTLIPLVNYVTYRESREAKGGKQDARRIKLCCIHVPSYHNQCNHCT